MKDYILPSALVILLFIAGFVVGNVSNEYCNSDYCISESETIEQLQL